MANDSGLRASEIKGVLLNAIEHYEEDLHAEEVGEVLEVKDGIARIYGLTNAMANEMLEITPSDGGAVVTALALNLEEDNIGAVVLGDWTNLHEGDEVRCTGRVLEVPTGEGYLGRVVDSLGAPLDGKGTIDPIEGSRMIDVVAPGIVLRRPVVVLRISCPSLFTLTETAVPRPPINLAKTLVGGVVSASPFPEVSHTPVNPSLR